MKKYEAVIFDYGNVLSLEQAPALVDEMASKLGQTTQELAAHYWELRWQYDRGDLDGHAYWQEIARRLGKTVSAAERNELIELDNRSWSRPNQPIVDWARSLKNNGIKIAILSNMPVDFRRALNVNCSWLPEFDHYTYSCELRLAKPEPAIYAHCLQGLASRPEQTLFIDDREPNITGAQALGIGTLHFTDTDAVLTALCNYFSLPAYL